MEGKLYFHNVGIKGAGAVIEGLHYYNGVIQSTSLNRRYFFNASMQTLRSIQAQANDGVEILSGHWGKALGSSVSATLYNQVVNSDFYIIADLEDVNSNDEIKRLDTGSLKGLSTGFMLTDESRMICNVCRENGLSDKEAEMKQRYSWFSSYFECEAEHVLGSKMRNGVRVTAELMGAVELLEYSIVSRGADPDAKVKEKIKENMQNGLYDDISIASIAESQGWTYSNFMNSLELGSGSGYSGKRIFTFGGELMDPKLVENPEMLLKEAERLETELDNITEERDTLQNEVKELKEGQTNHSDEDYVTLQEQNKDLEKQLENAVLPEDVATIEEEKTEIESKLKTAEADLASEKDIANDARTLRSTLEENYQAHYLSLYYDGDESEIAKNEAVAQMKTLTTSALYNSVQEMRRSLAKKRAKGRQSNTSDWTPAKSNRRIPGYQNDIGM